jgi:hypothetical protein
MSDVISKLNAAEKKAEIGKDTIPFGLEDENGQIVKVYVAAGQADDFEIALSTMLANADNDNNSDDVTDSTEIAEVLFKLKDKFEIINVEWPTIEGDEEEEQNPEQEMESDPNAEELGVDTETDPDAEGDLETDITGEEDAKTALQQVIDVLKADAEAKKAEAEAREAEAKQKEAEASAQSAASKVKQEEQILDMESYYKNKKEKEKEAGTLAKLAKWKHEIASDAEVDLATEEEEESGKYNLDKSSDSNEKVFSADDLAALIIQHLKYNN